MPTWLAIILFLCVVLLFAGELASVSAVGGWTLDELFSLWASDRHFQVQPRATADAAKAKSL